MIVDFTIDLDFMARIKDDVSNKELELLKMEQERLEQVELELEYGREAVIYNYIDYDE